MRTKAEIEAIVSQIRVPGKALRVLEKGDGFLLQLTYVEPDVWTGVPEEQHARKWYVSAHATETEIVETAWAAAQRSALHQLAEHFTYRGRLVYSPHFDVGRRIDLCDERAFDARPRKMAAPGNGPTSAKQLSYASPVQDPATEQASVHNDATAPLDPAAASGAPASPGAAGGASLGDSDLLAPWVHTTAPITDERLIAMGVALEMCLAASEGHKKTVRGARELHDEVMRLRRQTTEAARAFPAPHTPPKCSRCGERPASIGDVCLDCDAREHGDHPDQIGARTATPIVDVFRAADWPIPLASTEQSGILIDEAAGRIAFLCCFEASPESDADDEEAFARACEVLDRAGYDVDRDDERLAATVLRRPT